MIYRDYIEKHVNETPDETIFLLQEKAALREVTWRQFHAQINALGTALLETGPEAKICILGENSYQWALIHMTAVSGGGVAVSLDQEQREDALAEQIQRVEGDFVFYSSQYRKKALRLQERLPDVSFICWNSEEFEALLKKGRRAIENGCTRYMDRRPRQEDLACILFTSGTTGEQKGVMLSQGNIACMVTEALRMLELTPGDRCLLVLPLSHCYGCFYNLYTGLAARTLQCICPDFKRISQRIRLFHARILFLVPLVLQSLLRELEYSGQKPEEFFGGRIKWIMTAGAPVSSEIITEFSRLGIPVINGYGITECTAIVSVNPLASSRPDTVGLPGSSWEVKIEEDGEICIRGENVMLGYYGEAAASRTASENRPWFRTGDLGRWEADGHLAIIGRKKNLIILSNGKNVSPEALESHIQAIAGVKEVLVYEKEQRITAEIYADLSEEALSDAVKQLNRSLPPYERIQEVVIRTTPFDKTGGQKIKRR